MIYQALDAEDQTYDQSISRSDSNPYYGFHHIRISPTKVNENRSWSTIQR